MLNFNTIIRNEYESAYGNAYDLPLKRQYTRAKIHTARGNIKKRWYVYFRFRNPDTGLLEMQTPFYGNANTYKTKEERMAVLAIYRNIINKYLLMGYSPYAEGNVNLLKADVQAKVPKEQTSGPIKKEPLPEDNKGKDIRDNILPINEAIGFVMDIKALDLRTSSLRSIKSHAKVFLDWLGSERPELKYVNDIDRVTVKAFLNEMHRKTSARTANNYRASLSSIFGTLLENDKVVSNAVEKIRKLKTKPVKHKRYAEEMQKDIFRFLRERDGLMLLYVKFVSYSFMRPIEVCRLKIGDIDIKDRTLSFMPKNGELKTKIIPDILFRELPDISKMDREAYLFTAEGMGKFTNTRVENRRSYFTARFKKLIKGEFDLDLDHTLYSFRHTFITKLYREYRKEHSPFATKSLLMQITGHTSMTALETYLRDLDAEVPDDYSEHLEQNLDNDG